MVNALFTADQWLRVGELFDQLSTLPVEERNVHELDEPNAVREMLDRMLAAHDSTDAQLLDHTVSSIASNLFLADGGQVQAVDYRNRHFGPWRALEEIGRGGMAVVLRGERADGRFEKEVAIKLLPQAGSGSEQDRLVDEIRILARLEHPNIARLIDGGIDDDGTPYLVMEYVHGVPITEYCNTRNLDTIARVHLFLQVIEAVLHAHRHLIVHCDIKPANVLVSMEGQVKLVDFGIARLINNPNDIAPPGWFCSPGYCAPEQMQGAAPDTAQDVFSLGATLHELVFGRTIRNNRVATRMLLGVEKEPTGPPPPPPGRNPMARDLFAICKRALANDPSDRYGSANALLTDLQRLLSSEPVEARNGGATYRLGKWMRRYWIPATAAGVAAFALVIGSTAALWQAQQTRVEAHRAQLALEHSEQSLRRAEAVREFLLELFRSAQPDRPRDQLPSTEEILALGARRALDETLAPAPERFAMLDTLAEVYQSQNFLEQARPLVAAAHDLAYRDRHQRPADFARALRQQAWLAMRERDFETAETRFLEAEKWLAAEPDQLDLAHSLRADLGMLKVYQHDVQQAIAILEPLYAQASSFELGIRHQVVHALQIAHSLGGNLETTLKLHDELTPIVIERYRPDSLRYAIHLANGAGTKRELGLFDEAEANLNQAIDLYDEIFDRPVEYRAAARTQLARIYFYQGKFERALEEFAASTSEWARAMQQEPETYSFAYLHRGRVLARNRDWDEAEKALAQASQLLNADSRGVEDHLAYVSALQAWTACSRDSGHLSQDELTTMTAMLASLEVGIFEYRAQVHEARAQCLFQLGRFADALEEVEQALALEDAPGRALVTADRRLLRCRLLQALDRGAEISAELDDVEQMLESLALTGTAVNAQLSDMRNHLPQ